jgi:peroxiredoxin
MLDAAEQQYAARGLSVIGIGIDSAAKVQLFSANYGANYQILVAGSEAIELMKALGNPLGGLPFSVLLSRAGRLLHRKLGAFAAPELQGVLEPALR